MNTTTKQTTKPSILYAPAHYYLDGEHCGSELYWSYGIVRGMARRGYSGDALTGYVVGDCSGPNLNIHEVYKEEEFSTRLVYKLRFMVRYTLAARQLLKKQTYDIVHHILPFAFEQTFNPLVLLGLLKKTPFVIGPLQVPLDFISSDETGVQTREFSKQTSSVLFWLSQLPLRIFSFIFRLLSVRTMRAANALIVINKATKDAVLRLVPGARVEIIPPAVDVDQYSYSDFSTKVGEEFRFLSVGHLIKRKGARELLHAFHELYKQYPFIRLDYVGDGPEREYLEDYIKKNDLEGAVVLHGFIPNTEVAPYYARAHCFASLSKSESFGQMYVEAMASGVPVITSTTVGSREILRHGETGILLTECSSDAFVQAASPLLERWSSGDYEQLLSMSTASRARIESVFSWPVVLDQYGQLYQDLLR